MNSFDIVNSIWSVSTSGDTNYNILSEESLNLLNACSWNKEFEKDEVFYRWYSTEIYQEDQFDDAISNCLSISGVDKMYKEKEDKFSQCHLYWD